MNNVANNNYKKQFKAIYLHCYEKYPASLRQFMQTHPVPLIEVQARADDRLEVNKDLSQS